MTEEWRPVVGYEGFYEVSNEGRVRSCDREVGGKNGTTRRRKGAILKLDSSSHGYLRVTLQKLSNRSRRQVSNLVLEAFVGPRPEGMEACHFPDPDLNNNRIENLRWDTKSANMQDRIIHGNNPCLNRTHCPKGHEYTEENTYRYPSTGHRYCKTCNREEAARKLKEITEAARDLGVTIREYKRRSFV